MIAEDLIKRVNDAIIITSSIIVELLVVWLLHQLKRSWKAYIGVQI